MGFLGWTLIAIIGVVFVLVKGASSRAEKVQAARAATQRQIDDIPRQVAKNKSIHLPILVSVLKDEFSDSDNEVTELSLSDFYDKIGIWILAYDGGGCKACREFVEDGRRFDNGKTYKELVQSEIATVAPPPIAHAAKEDFPKWWDKMDRVIKFTTEKALASGYVATS